MLSDKISEVAKLVGRVLLGILPPESFQAALEKEGKLKKDAAQQISHEINRFVFAPVKDRLNQLYHIGTVPPEKPTAATTPKTETPAEAQLTPGVPTSKEKPEADTYREAVE